MTDITAPTPLKVTIYPLPKEESGKAKDNAFWSGDAPSFGDVLDIINPLQHIPLVSSIYQSLTGDTQSPASKVLGGALFGGPIGLIASVFDSIVEGETGTSIGGNILAAFNGDPVPALQRNVEETSHPYLTASQRTSYNAYVQVQKLVT